MGDLLGRETTHLAQREGHLGIRRQGGVAADEDEAQPVVLHALGPIRRGLLAHGFDGLDGLGQRGEAGAPANGVDGLEPAGRHQPRSGVGGDPVARPLFQRGPEGLVQRLLGEVEVTDQADERGEDPARFGAVDGVQRSRHGAMVSSTIMGPVALVDGRQRLVGTRSPRDG